MRLLLLLTVADIRAVGPGVWNGWKGQLMRELFGATEAVFRGGRTADAAATSAATARGGRRGAHGADHRRAGGGRLGRRDGKRLFHRFSADEYLAHAALARRASAQGGAAASASIQLESNAAEVIVAATIGAACSPT